MTPGHLFAIFLFGGALWIVAWGMAGAALARAKNREAWFGAVLGIFLGAIGLVILVVLPPLPEDASAASAAQKAGHRHSRGTLRAR